jgi:ketopantoate reductase
MSCLPQAAAVIAASSVQPSPRRSQQALSSTALYDSTLELIKRTARHYSSMSRDVRLGRSTEINYYNGEPALLSMMRRFVMAVYAV